MSDVTMTRGGERERIPEGGGGLQRARAEGSNVRPGGRPIVQRARNASFANKIRSVSFMQKEKEAAIPDSNASPWGVEETPEEAERAKVADAKSHADRQLQSRLVKKVSINVSALGSPLSPSMSFSSPRRADGTSPKGTAGSPAHATSPLKGIRRSMSRFGGNAAPDEDRTSMSPVSSASPACDTSQTGASSAEPKVAPPTSPGAVVSRTRSKVPEIEAGPPIAGNNAVTKPASLTATGDEAKGGEGEAIKNAGAKSKLRGSQRESDDKPKEKEKMAKGKSRKFGFSSKLRSAIGHGKKGDVEGPGGEDDDEEGSLEKEHDITVQRGHGDGGGGEDAGGGGKGVALAKDASLRDDDFVSYQTKPKEGKTWSRMSRVLK